jgi:hypothetical protein
MQTSVGHGVRIADGLNGEISGLLGALERSLHVGVFELGPLGPLAPWREVVLNEHQDTSEVHSDPLRANLHHILQTTQLRCDLRHLPFV